MSRPEKQLTEQELAEIETMAGLGLSFDDIAAIKGLCDDTLKKHAKTFLKRGKAKAKAQVMQTAYRMAISGKIPSMTMFWLKTQAGWRDGQVGLDSLEDNLSNLAERINQSNKPSQTLLVYLTEVLDQLRQGVLDPKVASSIASMSNILLKAADQGQLEERLASLERIIKSHVEEPLDLELELDIEPAPAKNQNAAPNKNQIPNPVPTPAPMHSNRAAKGSFSKRLDKLEADLTPRQFILKYVEQALSYPNQDEWFQIVCSDEFTAWIERGLENMRASVQRDVPDPLEKEKACRKASQELIYLHSLALWPSQSHEEMHFNYRYQFSRLACLLKKKHTGYFALWDEKMKSNFQQMKKGSEQLWIELKVDQRVAEKISQDFFNGQPLLMTCQNHFLDQGMRALERIMDYLEGNMDDAQAFCKLERRKKGVTEMNVFLQEMVLDREALLQEAERQADVQFLEVKRNALISIYEAKNRHEEIRKMYQQMFKEEAGEP